MQPPGGRSQASKKPRKVAALKQPYWPAAATASSDCLASSNVEPKRGTATGVTAMGGFNLSIAMAHLDAALQELTSAAAGSTSRTRQGPATAGHDSQQYQQQVEHFVCCAAQLVADMVEKELPAALRQEPCSISISSPSSIDTTRSSTGTPSSTPRGRALEEAMPVLTKQLHTIICWLACEYPPGGSGPPSRGSSQLAGTAMRIFWDLVIYWQHRSIQTVALLLDGGLLLHLLAGNLLKWAGLTEVACNLREWVMFKQASSTTPEQQLPWSWELLHTHQDKWWLGLCSGISELQQVSQPRLGFLHGAGPGWASTRLAQALAPGVSLNVGCIIAPEEYAVGLLESCVLAQLLVFSKALLNRPICYLASSSEQSHKPLVLYMPPRHAAASVELEPPSLLHLQTVAEALLTTVLVPSREVVCVELLLLSLLVEAATPDVKEAFISSIHFQQVLRVLQEVATWDLTLSFQDVDAMPVCKAASVAAAAAAAAAGGEEAQAAPSGSPAAAAAEAAVGDQDEAKSLQGLTLTASQLVMGCLKVLTMHDPAQAPVGGQPGSQHEGAAPAGGMHGLRHLLHPDAPATSLCWAPGLNPTPALWGLLEQCVRAQGVGGKAAMQLAERWVQLVQEIGSIPSCSSGINGALPAATAPTNGNGSGRGTSWYAAIGSLLVSMAKFSLRSWDKNAIMSTQTLLMQLASQLQHMYGDYSAACGGHLSGLALDPLRRRVQGRQEAASQPVHSPHQQQQQQHGQRTGSRLDAMLLLGAVQRAAAALGWWVGAAHHLPPGVHTVPPVACMQRCLSGVLSDSARMAWGLSIQDHPGSNPPAGVPGSCCSSSSSSSSDSSSGQYVLKGMWSAAAVYGASTTVSSNRIMSYISSVIASIGTNGAGQPQAPAAAASKRLSSVPSQQKAPSGSIGSLDALLKQHRAHLPPMPSGRAAEAAVRFRDNPAGSQVQQHQQKFFSAAPPMLYTTVCAYIPCMNLSGPSEVTLVINRGGVVCGGCGVVRWCSQACAAKAWSAHRKECKRLGAANKAYQARKAASTT